MCMHTNPQPRLQISKIIDNKMKQIINEKKPSNKQTNKHTKRKLLSDIAQSWISE